MVKRAVSFLLDEQCLSNNPQQLQGQYEQATTASVPPASPLTRRRISSRVSSRVATPPPASRDSIAVADFPTYISTWLATGEIEKHSALTIGSRQERTDRLLWFARREGYERISVVELRAFFAYLVRSHPEGRWDNPRCKKPLTPGRVKAFHSSLRTFFRFLEDEEVLGAGQSPMRRIKAPIDRPDQITPFTEADCHALLAAAKDTTAPYRDTAIVSVLLDTGLRAAELVALTMEDCMLDKGVVVVRSGKGNKMRSVPISAGAKRAVFEYIQRERGASIEENEPLFLSNRGTVAGEGISAHGLGQIFKRLGKVAKLSGVRCSPHTCRHTAAITFIRAGGNSFTLQQMLGHESMVMTQNYVKVAEADLTAQHRQFSPLAHIKKSKGGR